MTLYKRFITAGCEIASHYSDMYVRWTPDAVQVSKATGRKPHALFKSQIDGKLWAEFPLQFDPYWESRGMNAQLIEIGTDDTP